MTYIVEKRLAKQKTVLSPLRPGAVRAGVVLGVRLRYYVPRAVSPISYSAALLAIVDVLAVVAIVDVVAVVGIVAVVTVVAVV